ncbi:MAG: alpha/beta hydrolase family protein [Cyanobacteriota bacterium]
MATTMCGWGYLVEKPGTIAYIAKVVAILSVGIDIAASGVSYQEIARLSAAELSQLLADKFPSFDTPKSQHLLPPTLKRDVILYKVNYTIDVSHLQFAGPRVVSGLLVVPDGLVKGSQPAAPVPLAVYNHGTLFSGTQCPSNVVTSSGEGPDRKWSVDSPETLFNLALLADRGYAMLAPDYVGFGASNIHQAYGVKSPTTTAIVGLLESSRSVLSALGVQPRQLFANGWSQGGLNTQWMTQELESLQIPLAAAAAESPFNELADTFRWWITRSMADPRQPFDPGPWLPLCLGILIRSYESWFGLQGLLEALVKNEVIPAGKDSDGNIVPNPLGVTYREIIGSFGEKGADVVKFESPNGFSNYKWDVVVNRGGDDKPTTIPGFAGNDMLVDGALDQTQGVVAQFLQLLKADSPRNWTYSTPLKAWYGLEDEGLAPDLVAPEMALKGGPNVSLVPVVAASHRQTFLNALVSSPGQPAGSSENFLDWFSTFWKESVASPSLQLSENSLKVVSDDFGLLPVQIQTTMQVGERPLHVQILRTRGDGTSEVIGALGGTSADANQLQTLGSERVLLQVGDQLSFQLLSRSGDGFDPSTTEIRTGAPGGGFDVTLRDGGGGKSSRLQFAVTPAPQEFTATLNDRIAAPQDGVSEGLLQLRQGQKLSLQVTTDCAFTNRLGFVRVNVDPVTGLPLGTVGSQAIAIDSPQFSEQIDNLLDPGFQITQGGRRISSPLEWTIGQDGLYTPVLITQEQNVFCGVRGDAIMTGNQQMRLLGQNSFGFEDLKGRVSDYDWNDVVFNIVNVI